MSFYFKFRKCYLGDKRSTSVRSVEVLFGDYRDRLAVSFSFSSVGTLVWMDTKAVCIRIFYGNQTTMLQLFAQHLDGLCSTYA